MKRTDPLTEEEFLPLRSNQQFATRENQIKYNNLRAREKRLIKKEINQALDKNRSALELLLEFKDHVIVSKHEMLRQGFNFICQTHSRIINDKKYIFIYEYGYSPLNQESYEIIKHA